MSDVVLDASAVIAFLRGEAGAEQVGRVLPAACIGVVNFAEVVSHFIHLGAPPAEVDDMLAELSLEVIGADAELAVLAGRLRGATAQAGLSLGDRFCLALAVRQGLPAWTADRGWQAVAEAAGAKVVVFR